MAIEVDELLELQQELGATPSDNTKGGGVFEHKATMHDALEVCLKTKGEGAVLSLAEQFGISNANARRIQEMSDAMGS